MGSAPETQDPCGGGKLSGIGYVTIGYIVGVGLILGYGTMLIVSLWRAGRTR